MILKDGPIIRNDVYVRVNREILIKKDLPFTRGVIQGGKLRAPCSTLDTYKKMLYLSCVRRFGYNARGL